MKVETPLATLFTASALLATATASVVLPRHPTLEDELAFGVEASLDAWKRATPQAPNGYTPSSVNCPAQRPSIRNAAALSPSETSWLETRRNNTVGPMRDLLRRLNITGLDTDAYINNNAQNASALPNIGLAFSGGGYRALMNGAGALAAFDSRTPNSTAKGQIGGLLQSATYIAGLSGGSWLVGSIYTNNFTSVQNIIDTTPDTSGSLWQFGNSIFVGPATGKIQLLSTAQYWDAVYNQVEGKDLGFNTSITDYWGRALSFQLVNASSGGPGYTWSSVQDDPYFTQGNAPMPIVVADGRAPNELLIPSNTTVFEMTPYEFGSWDPSLFGFAPMRYVGSNFSNGTLPDDQQCIAGFDSVSYVMGTSSTLFNQFLLNLNSTSAPSILKNIVGSLLYELGQRNDDIAPWNPNPFYGYNVGSSLSANSKDLTLVDGGEDLQNIPLHPLIQPVRHVDVIFAVDASADTDAPGAYWPNGTALVATYQRSLDAQMQNGTVFPSIPDQNTFVNLGLNNRPTFFGCDTTNFTGNTPLLVYVPNSPYVYNSNVSTFDPDYNNTERNAIIQNGYNVATMGNGTRDAQWPTCVGCAILSRSMNRTNTPVPDVCRKCFDRYCWNGTVDSRPASYNPTSVFAQIKVASGAQHVLPSIFATFIALCASSLLLI